MDFEFKADSDDERDFSEKFNLRPPPIKIDYFEKNIKIQFLL